MGELGGRPWARAVAAACTMAAIVTAAVVTAGPAPGAAQPAQAGQPTVTVEPTVFDVQSGQVEVTYTDIPYTQGTYVAQCAASVVDGTGADPAQWCRTMWEVSEPSRTITAMVYAGFRAFSGRLVVCADVPGGCVVAVGAASPFRLDGFVPIELAPPVDVTVTPSEGVAAGQELDVAIAGLDPGAAYDLHLCRDFLWDTAYCLEEPAAAVVASAEGTATATVEAPMEIARDSASCAVMPCGVGVISEASRASGAPIVAGMGTYSAIDASVTVTPNQGIALGESVRVDLASLVPGRSYTIRACYGGPGAPTYLVDRCATSPSDPVARVVAGADGTAAATLVPPWAVETPAGSVSCQLSLCALGAVLDGTEWVVGSGPYQVAHATATLTPDTGLVDGQEATLTVEGLRPGGRFHLRLCSMTTVASEGLIRECMSRAEDPAFAAGEDGTAEATIAVSQRIGSGGPGEPRIICRDEPCAVAVVDDELEHVPAGAAYAMAHARLSATPDTGLADGDVVTLAGVDVMASYEGGTYWVLPTGVWGVGQCGAAVAVDQSIPGVFRHCAPAPGSGPLDVPGSTFETDVTVRAQVDPIIGDRVDCTAGPGTCVLALTRVESDGRVTVHTVPLTFGS